MTSTESAPRPAVTVVPQVDPELSAMQVVLEVLSPLDSDARERIIGYVFRRLGLAPPVASGVPPAVARPSVEQATLSAPVAPAPAATAPTDIRSLKEQKQPRTAVEMAALVAYYLSELAPGDYRKSEIEAADITTYFKQAGFPLPGRPRNTLLVAKSAGYLDSAARGAYRLNPVGHNLVTHGLPARNGEAPSRALRKKATGKAATKRAGKSRRR